MNLARALDTAIQYRQKLLPITNAMRLVNGAGDGMEGLLIDGYNRHLQVQVLSGHWHQHIREISRLLSEITPVDYLIVKSRRDLEIKTDVLVGTEPQTVVEEHGLKFAVNLNDGLNCGLFLDMRHNRRMVGQASQGKKMLNCFAYTCSFGVHARANGAASVINTDISRKTLERGKTNYQLNDLHTPGECEGFLRADSVSFLQRAFKKGNGFDMVILDPPSFARHEGKVFQIKRDLPKLMALAVAVLNPGGHLLVSTNYSEISHADLEGMLSRGLSGRKVSGIKRVVQDEDFRGSNSFKESYLAGLWVKFI